MARLKNIKYVLKSLLGNMESFGEKKHVAQSITRRERRIAKNEGKSVRER